MNDKDEKVVSIFIPTDEQKKTIKDVSMKIANLLDEINDTEIIMAILMIVNQACNYRHGEIKEFYFKKDKKGK